MLLYGDPTKSKIPLWKTALDAFTKIPTNLNQNLKEAGFSVETHTILEKIPFPKSLYYEWLRARAVSAYELLSDEDIEKGIAELEETTLRSVGMEEEFLMEFMFVCDVGTLP